MLRLHVTVGFDVDLTGFEVPEVDLILDAATEREGDPGPEDDLPDVRQDQPAVTRTGDLWFLGPKGDPRHRLLAVDARDPAAMAALMGEERATMVVTDPPYNVAIEGHVCRKGRTRHAEFAMASGEMSEEEFTSFLQLFLAAALTKTATGALLYVFMDWRHLFEMLTAAHALDLKLINLCVWAKSNGGMRSLYRSRHELVAVLRLGDAPHRNNVELGKHGRSRTNVWTYAGMNAFGSRRAAELAMHPTVNPVAMIADAIRDVTRRGDLVLDPFCCSGTVLIAAEKAGRRARAIEIDCHYCDVAIHRWEIFTGKAAVLAETGETFEEVAERREAERASPREGCASKPRRRAGTDGDYIVGYGRAPREHQFKKGDASPNPKGRPRSAIGRTPGLVKVLTQLVTLRMQGQERSVPHLEAMLQVLKDKGDLRSIQTMLKLTRELNILKSQEGGALFIERDRLDREV
jgi:DNA modification methylase